MEDLTRRMRAMRASGADPYVLLLGAGASIASGARASRTVVESVAGSYNLDAFDDHLRRSSPDERFAVLRDLVEGTASSPGYAALAALIRAGYFREILSTNFDPLLEDAIAAAQMRRRDYVFLVHGVMPPDFIAGHFDRSVPRIKLLKLHGDLFYRRFYYTGDEITEFPPEIEGILDRYLNRRDVLIVGHSMSDTDINRCLRRTGGGIWWVNPSDPTEQLVELMKARASEGNAVTGKAGAFDEFFTRLHGLLLGGTAPVNVDVVAQAIFSIAAPGEAPVGSGFLLHDTGLVVTDSSILRGLGLGLQPGVPARMRAFAGGADAEATLVVAPQAELDYAVFKLERPVAPSPLTLADAPASVGDPVTACISVGESQGFRDGTVTAVGKTVSMTGFDQRRLRIRNLIETTIHVEGGACGAPLVGSSGVVGVIVAGNGRSYALTAERLRRMIGARSGTGVGTTGRKTPASPARKGRAARGGSQ